jgi:AhpD family alkylhydroperoxidase
MNTEPRLNYSAAAPAAIHAMVALDAAVGKSGLEHSLIDLVKLRASQINGCSYCIDLHTKEARQRGESERRLYCLQAWRETPLYTDRERAALAWTEAVTLISKAHVSDEIFADAKKEFTDAELVNLNLAVVAINAWNRFGISFHIVPQA